MGRLHRIHPLLDGSRGEEPKFVVGLASDDKTLLLSGSDGVGVLVLYPHRVNGKDGMIVGCTWFSAEVVDRIWALLHPATIDNLQKISAALETAIFDSPVPAPVPAEIVTKLPRMPKPRTKKASTK